MPDADGWCSCCSSKRAILALAAAALGTLFTWWATPFVVSHINPPDNPVRLSLPIDWRVFGFSVTLTVVVTMLFGLITGAAGVGRQPGERPEERR